MYHLQIDGQAKTYDHFQVALETLIDLPENSDVEILWSFKSRPLVLDERRIVESDGLSSVLRINQVTLQGGHRSSKLDSFIDMVIFLCL